MTVLILVYSYCFLIHLYTHTYNKKTYIHTYVGMRLWSDLVGYVCRVGKSLSSQHRTQLRQSGEYTHTLIHSYTHTHTLIRSYTHVIIHSCTHTLVHSYTHTLIYVCIGINLKGMSTVANAKTPRAWSVFEGEERLAFFYRTDYKVLLYTCMCMYVCIMCMCMYVCVYRVHTYPHILHV